MTATAPLEPYVLADDPVLDMLNTRANVDGEPIEFWQSDTDVERWLVRLDWVSEGETPVFESGSLLVAAKALREVILAVLDQR